MLSPFGKFVRRLRIDRGVKLKDMADSIGVSSAFLSAVETGNRPIPDTVVSGVRDYFCLIGEQLQELQSVVELSRTDFKISLPRDADDVSRNLIAAFARRFDELDVDKKEQILALLRE